MTIKLLINLIKILVIVSCFSFVYYNLDTKLAISILSKINLDYLFPSIISFSVYLFIYGVFIFKIYNYLFPLKLNLSSWGKIFINGNFFNSIPFLGFVYKGYRLNIYKISIKNYLFANVFISWLAITIFFLIFSLEIVFFVTPKISIFNIPVYLILLVLSMLAFISPKIGSFFLSKFKIDDNIVSSLFSFLQKKVSKEIVKHYLSYGLLLHLLIFLNYFFIIKLLNIPIGLKIIIVIFLINEVIDSIPIPNNNFLLTEIIGGFTATFVGVAFTEFVLIKFLFRLINLIIIIPVFLIINILFKSEL